jgi:hypothetical protein
LAAWLCSCDTDIVQGILSPQDDRMGGLGALHDAVSALLVSGDSKHRMRLLSLLLSVLQHSSPRCSGVIRDSGEKKWVCHR